MSNKENQTNPSGPVTDRWDNSPAPVTERWEEPQVTDRLIEPSVTHRWDESISGETAITLDPLGIKREELVDDRYRIQEGPLGGYTGEAEIYKCHDESTGQTVALKFYRHHIVPKKDVMAQLIGLAHPDIVCLKAYGLWSGRFYEVMEYCAGGSLDEFMPLTEEEAILYLQEIINGLNYCHDQGIVHRDIKPSNLFFRYNGKKDLVIGDFGISSVMEGDEKVRKTQSFGNITVDYTAPELFKREKLVSPKTDYYALGITLIHLLSGSSPFHGMDVNSIISAHLTEEIEPPGKVSARFRQLVKGLTEKDPGNRWGYRQVQQWLKGEVVRADDGTVWKPDKYAGKDSPYPACEKAKNPRQLAAYLHEIDAEKDLFRGHISQWVQRFDAPLSDRIIEIEEDPTYKVHNRRLGVEKLRYLLDPTYPLMILNIPVHTIEDLVKILQSDDNSILKELDKAFWKTYIEIWIDATQEISRKKELLQRIKTLRERLEKSDKKHLGPFALLYMLAPGVPLKLEPGVEITKPEDLEEILSKHPHIDTTVRRFIFEGRMEEWLGAAFPDRSADYNFVLECSKIYQNNQDLGFYAIRWHFDPYVPFPFGTHKVTLPKQLAALIDADNQTRQQGIELLKNGWLRTWLTVTAKLKDPRPFDDVLKHPNASWEGKMESVLHLLDPGIPWPKITADRKAIHLGKVPNESKKTVSIRLHNSGPGYIAGIVTLEGDGKGFNIDRTRIEGGPETVTLTIDPLGVPVGSHQTANLVVSTNGGALKIPVSYEATAPIGKMIGRSLLRGGILAVVLGLFRLLLVEFEPEIKAKIVDGISWKELPISAVFIPLGLLLIGIIGGAIYYLVRIYNVKRD